MATISFKALMAIDICSSNIIIFSTASLNQFNTDELAIRIKNAECSEIICIASGSSRRRGCQTED